MVKIFETMLHQTWVPAKESYNTTATHKGTIIFWIGTALFECRYTVHPALLQLYCHSIGQNRVGTFGEVSYIIDHVPSREEVEKILTEQLAPCLTACVDGRYG